MKLTEIDSMIESIGLPYAYYQFPGTQEPPFICFYYPGRDDFVADNSNYAPITELVIELYTNNKDFTAEGAVESALEAAEIVYEKDESYIDTEKLYMITYTTEVLITNGED